MPKAPKSQVSPQDAATQPSFSEAIDELASILERFKYESLPLEEALGLFEQGLQHVKVCQNTLNQSKGKLEVLQAQMEEPTLFEETEGHEAEESTQTFASSENNPLPGEHLLLKLPLTQPIDQGDLETVLKQLRLSFELKTQGKPVVYQRDNGSGFEAIVPLANGSLTLSTFKLPALLVLAAHGVPTLNMQKEEVLEALEGMLPLKE